MLRNKFGKLHQKLSLQELNLKAILSLDMTMGHLELDAKINSVDYVID